MSSSTAASQVGQVRQDLLHRLRWNVFDSIDAIEVEDGLKKDGTERRKLLHSHTIATESLAEPPIYKMTIDSLELNDAVTFMSAPKDISRPHIAVRMPSDGPMTIWDFVIAVHGYLSQHEEHIRAYRTPFIPAVVEDGKDGKPTTIVTTEELPDFFFNYARIDSIGDRAAVSVRTFATGEFGCTAEVFCARQRQNAAREREQRHKLAITTPAPYYSPGTSPFCIRQDLLFRLRWNVYRPLDEIKIEDGLHKNGTKRHRAFLSDSTASKSLAEPPLCSATVMAMDVLMAKQFGLAPADYQYDALLIQSTDGSPLTIKDFVVRVHAHIREHKRLIVNYKQATGRRNSIVPDTAEKLSTTEPGLFISSVTTHFPEGKLLIGVNCFLEGEYGTTAEEFWKRQQTRASYGVM
jgi:hypothetical protein